MVAAISSAGVSRGFTLVELLVAIVVLSVLVSLAVPAFNQLAGQQTLRAAISEFRSGLMLARSEAIKRNSSVTVSPKNSSWGNGWEVKASSLSSTALQEIAVGSFSDRVSVTPSPSGQLVFNSWGRPVAGCTQFQIDLVSTSLDCRSCVSVLGDGRAIVSARVCGSCPDSQSATPAWSGACL